MLGQPWKRRQAKVRGPVQTRPVRPDRPSGPSGQTAAGGRKAKAGSSGRIAVQQNARRQGNKRVLCAGEHGSRKERKSTNGRSNRHSTKRVVPKLYWRTIRAKKARLHVVPAEPQRLGGGRWRGDSCSPSASPTRVAERATNTKVECWGERPEVQNTKRGQCRHQHPQQAQYPRGE